MKKNNKLSIIIKLFLLIFVFSILLPQQIFAIQNLNHLYPKKANYYLHWTLDENTARELSKWDLVILDMEVQYRQPELIKKMRRWNPNIVLLVYITPQEIKQDAAISYSEMRRKLVSGIHPDWYLKNTKGNNLYWWPGTQLLNVTNDSFLYYGKRFNSYLVNFVVNELLSTGLWDGVFYDNAWDNITWFAGNDIDLDLDGKKDSNLDQKWIDGMKFIYSETRRITNDKYVILGNNETLKYHEELNGMMLENFGEKDWNDYMNRYSSNDQNNQKPTVNIVNFNTGNSDKNNDYKKVRYGLTSSLLEDGYFSYDYGDKDHGQTWWYDEYDVGLGKSISDSSSKQGYNNYKPDVWTRNFENGLAIVNSTDSSKTVELGGEYEKIHGTQDPEINDGSIITKATVDSKDGLILLKTFSELNDVLFTNGDFARFFNADGTRVRNGFFVFDEEYKGGEQVAKIDLDGNGLRDLLVVKKNKIMAWRDDGQPFMNIYPYTADYPGKLRVAVADISEDGTYEIYVAPEAGYPMPIKIYTRHGRKMYQEWYPFGQNYQGGFSIALGNLDGFWKQEIILGSGKGVEPRVRVYDFEFNELYNFLAFEKWFTGGINVASGDLDGDGKDEIIVGAGEGKEPIIKVFDQTGKQLYQEFTAYSSFGKNGIEVRALDVDFDGKDDIVGLSSDF